ncbi:unnamed protein product, partial [Urochloa humidicola]
GVLHYCHSNGCLVGCQLRHAVQFVDGATACAGAHRPTFRLPSLLLLAVYSDMPDQFRRLGQKMLQH